jgi:hypothetical protein
MHTLIIEGTMKPGKKDEFTKAWRNEILPTLKKQNGFVDEVLLFDTADPDRGVGLGFWKTKKTLRSTTVRSFHDSWLQCSICLRGPRPCAPSTLKPQKRSGSDPEKPPNLTSSQVNSAPETKRALGAREKWARAAGKKDRSHRPRKLDQELSPRFQENPLRRRT